jgi:4-hydroxybenzoate polyprenyltransferase
MRTPRPRSTRCGKSWGLTSKGARESQTFAGEALFTRYVNFVRLPHTVFALPFALLGVVVASRAYPVTGRTLGLVVLAFTAARFVAMGFNRIADRGLDARNPRTRARELPAGRLTLRQAWTAVVTAAVVFLWAAWALNPLCFRLSPIALAVITLYSYSKRFTWWSHLWLGFGDAIAGPAGYLAVSGEWSAPWWLLWMMAAAVTFWIGGFDIFYALQDEAFDRDEGLHSAVVRFGRGRAILVGKLLHGLAVLALIAFGAGAGLGIAYYAGVAVGAALIAYEHQLVKPGDLSRLDAAFFTANGIVSIVVFLGALVDRIIRKRGRGKGEGGRVKRCRRGRPYPSLFPLPPSPLVHRRTLDGPSPQIGGGDERSPHHPRNHRCLRGSVWRAPARAAGDTPRAHVAHGVAPRLASDRGGMRHQ